MTASGLHPHLTDDSTLPETILTHHAASRQAAMAPYGRMLLAGDTA